MVTGAAPTGADPVEVGADRALFVYGVVLTDGPHAPASGAVEELTGLDGAPVELVPGGHLAAAVTRVVLDRPQGRRVELLAYQSVLDALAESGPVAPIRFGSVLPDVEAVVEEFLLPQQEEFEAILRRLQGRRQYNLRATYVEEAVLAELVTTDPEIRALRKRTRDLPEDASYGDRMRLGELVARGLEDRSAYDAAVLLDCIAPVAAEFVMRTAPSAKQVLDVALLVDEARTQELVARLEQLAETVHERIRMRLLGPLAAYDFVGEAGWD